MRLLHEALTRSIGQVVNAHRNAPIQGGVADAMLVAYGELWRLIAGWSSVEPVVTVHDSLVVECDERDADEVAWLVFSALQRGFARFCPDVPVAVSFDVRGRWPTQTMHPLRACACWLTAGAQHPI